jgi:DNA-binding transcriptional LysR family regulator
LSGGADELHVTHAAIGHMIRGLEETLDVELFDRSQSGAARLEYYERERIGRHRRMG